MRDSLPLRELPRTGNIDLLAVILGLEADPAQLLLADKQMVLAGHQP